MIEECQIRVEEEIIWYSPKDDVNYTENLSITFLPKLVSDMASLQNAANLIFQQQTCQICNKAICIIVSPNEILVHKLNKICTKHMMNSTEFWWEN